MKQIFPFLIIGAFLACNKQNVPIKVLSSTYKCNFLGADNKQ